MRAWLIGVALLLLVAECGLQSPALAANQVLTADQAKIVASARASALEYTQKLPDFICTQITHREVSAAVSIGNPLAGVTGVSMGQGPVGLPDSAPGGGKLNDAIEERLTFFHEKESYEVIAINGKKAPGEQHMDLAGAISAGEFGSALHDIFDEQSHAVFNWERAEKVRGRQAYVFEFHVPKESGMIVVYKNSGQEITTAYKGKVYIDESTMEVVRLTMSAEIPADFPVRSSDRTVLYEPTEIAGKSYMLPFRSEVRMTDDTHLYVNTIQFKNYEKFAVESTIHYDGGKTQ